MYGWFEKTHCLRYVNVTLHYKLSKTYRENLKNFRLPYPMKQERPTINLQLPKFRYYDRKLAYWIHRKMSTLYSRVINEINIIIAIADESTISCLQRIRRPRVTTPYSSITRRRLMPNLDVAGFLFRLPVFTCTIKWMYKKNTPLGYRYNITIPTDLYI